MVSIVLCQPVSTRPVTRDPTSLAALPDASIMSKVEKDGEKRPTIPHVLKPHHVVLCTLFILIYRDTSPKRFPPSFLLHMQRLLLSEVSEVRLLLSPHFEYFIERRGR